MWRKPFDLVPKLRLGTHFSEALLLPTLTNQPGFSLIPPERKNFPNSCPSNKNSVRFFAQIAMYLWDGLRRSVLRFSA